METADIAQAVRDAGSAPLDQITTSATTAVLRRVLPDDTPVLEVAAFNSSI